MGGFGQMGHFAVRVLNQRVLLRGAAHTTRSLTPSVLLPFTRLPSPLPRHALQAGVGPSTGNTVTENYLWRLNVEKRALEGQV